MKVMQLIQELQNYFRNPNTESEVEPPSKLQISLLLVLLLVSLLIYLKNYDSFQLGAYHDDSEYAVLAKSIAQSESYGLINVPGDPAHSRYPFGFPLLLSIFVSFFPQQIMQMKVVSLLCTLLVTILLFWGWPYLSRIKSYWWGLIIAAIYSLSPLVIDHTTRVMSEPAFTAFMLIALIITEKYLIDDQKRPLQAFLVGFVTVFVISIRAVGIALLIAIIFRILVLQVNKSLKWERLLFVMLGGICFLLLVFSLTPITVRDLLPSNIYFDQLDAPIDTLRDNDIPVRDTQSSFKDQFLPGLFMSFSNYAKYHVRRVVVPIGGGLSEIEFGMRFGIPSLQLISGFTIFVITLIGSLLFFKRQGLAPTVIIFEVLYFGLLLLWPFSTDRLLYPILPFLVYQFFWGVWLIIEQIERFEFLKPNIVHNLSNYVLMSAIIVILFFSIYKAGIDESTSLDYIRDLQVGTTWLRENSQPDSLIMAQQPESVYLYSQRKTINQKYFSSHFELNEFLQENDVNYILVAPQLVWHFEGALYFDSYTGEKFIPMLEEILSNGDLRVVFNSDEDLVTVYQVVE